MLVDTAAYLARTDERINPAHLEASARSASDGVLYVVEQTRHGVVKRAAALCLDSRRYRHTLGRVYGYRYWQTGRYFGTVTVVTIVDLGTGTHEGVLLDEELQLYIAHREKW